MFDEAKEMGKLLEMKSIGVDTALKLYSVGIRDPETLRKVGAKDAYRKVSEYFGEDAQLLRILKTAIKPAKVK